jgi:hypothetical protein
MRQLSLHAVMPLSLARIRREKTYLMQSCSLLSLETFSTDPFEMSHNDSSRAAVQKSRGESGRVLSCRSASTSAKCRFSPGRYNLLTPANHIRSGLCQNASDRHEGCTLWCCTYIHTSGRGLRGLHIVTLITILKTSRRYYDPSMSYHMLSYRIVSSRPLIPTLHPQI